MVCDSFRIKSLLPVALAHRTSPKDMFLLGFIYCLRVEYLENSAIHSALLYVVSPQPTSPPSSWSRVRRNVSSVKVLWMQCVLRVSHLEDMFGALLCVLAIFTSLVYVLPGSFSLFWTYYGIYVMCRQKYS